MEFVVEVVGRNTLLAGFGISLAGSLVDTDKNILARRMVQQWMQQASFHRATANVRAGLATSI